MEKQVSTAIEKWSGRASNAYTLWPLVPAGAVGGLMAYFSTFVAWIHQFGAFGWAATGLLSFFIMCAATFLAGAAREKWVYAKIARQRAIAPDAINPIESEFTRKRIKLDDLVRPSTHYIENKVFTDCQLLGPANLIISGGAISGAGFINCNWVVVREDMPIFGAIMLRNVTIRGGDLSDCTMLVSEKQLEFIKTLPVPVITRTGVDEIDNRVIGAGRTFQNGPA